MITTINEWKKINENGDAPQIIDNLKDLKKFMRKVSTDRDGSKTGIRGFWGDFSTSMTGHRGNFIFHENPSSWYDDGKMDYTGSGSPEIYINKVNTDILNKLGWEMVDLGNRSIQVKKLN